MTARGVNILEPGALYEPYCNECGRQARYSETNLEDARQVARAHQCEKKEA